VSTKEGPLSIFNRLKQTVSIRFNFVKKGEK
jgi:hypothetical protein